MFYQEITISADSGCEQFMNIKVKFRDTPAVNFHQAIKIFGKKKILDKKARKELPPEYDAVLGIARISWKSEEDRQKCIANQSSRNGAHGTNRWANVLYATKLISQDKLHRFPEPIFKKLKDIEDNLFPVDGARRLMAYLEAGFTQIHVVLIVEAES